MKLTRLRMAEQSEWRMAGFVRLSVSVTQFEQRAWQMVTFTRSLAMPLATPAIAALTSAALILSARVLDVQGLG